MEPPLLEMCPLKLTKGGRQCPQKIILALALMTENENESYASFFLLLLD